MFFRPHILWWKRADERKARDPVHVKFFLLERGNKLVWRGRAGRGDTIRTRVRGAKRKEQAGPWQLTSWEAQGSGREVPLGPPGDPGEWDLFSLRIEDQVGGKMVIIFFKYYAESLRF